MNFDRYAHFQGEQGRPNSTFLYLGSAVRKAYSMGPHKDAHINVQSTSVLKNDGLPFSVFYFQNVGQFAVQLQLFLLF